MPDATITATTSIDTSGFGAGLEILKEQYRQATTEVRQSVQRVVDAEKQATDAIASGHVQLGASLQAVAEQEREALNGLITKQLELKAAVEEANRALGHQVSEMAAASGTIRVFEGALPIRAIENFATKTLGLGPILQAAFPIIGAVDLGEELYRLWEKTDPLIAAEKELAVSVKKTDEEFTRSIAHIEKLNVELQKLQFGAAAGFHLKAFYDAEDAALDLANLKTLDRKIDEMEQKLRGGGFTSAAPGLVGMFLTQRSEAAANLQLEELYNQRENADTKFTERSKQTEVDRAEQKKDAAREAKEAGLAAAAAQRKLQQDLKSGYDAMLSDLKADHEVTKAEELAFRENELEEVKQWGKRTKDLKSSLGGEIGQLSQEVDRQQDAAAKRNRAEQLTEENRQFELQIQAIEEHSREVAAAERRAAEEQKRAVEEARAAEGARSAGAVTSLSIDKDELALAQQGGLFAKSTAEQVAYLEQVRDIDQQIETEKLRHVLRDIQIDAVNGDTKKLEDDQKQLAIVQRQVHLQMERDTAAILNKQQQDYRQFFNTVNQGFVSAFGQWLNGHRSFVAGLQQLWTQMVTNFASALIQMGLRWTEQQVLMTVTHAAAQQAQVAATATAAVQKKAINATTTITEINANAVKAATGAYAATVDIPVVGPVLAPIAAGVAYAGVIALGALAAFETGGIVPNTGVALVHRGEAVLPQPLTHMLTSAAGQGGGGGVTVNGGVHIHSPSGDPKQHATDFMSQLRRMNLRMA